MLHALLQLVVRRHQGRVHAVDLAVTLAQPHRREPGKAQQERRVGEQPLAPEFGSPRQFGVMRIEGGCRAIDGRHRRRAHDPRQQPRLLAHLAQDGARMAEEDAQRLPRGRGARQAVERGPQSFHGGLQLVALPVIDDNRILQRVGQRRVHRTRKVGGQPGRRLRVPGRRRQEAQRVAQHGVLRLEFIHQVGLRGEGGAHGGKPRLDRRVGRGFRALQASELHADLAQRRRDRVIAGIEPHLGTHDVHVPVRIELVHEAQLLVHRRALGRVRRLRLLVQEPQHARGRCGREQPCEREPGAARHGAAGVSPDKVARNLMMSSLSCRGADRPSWYLNMTSTASLSVAAEPSWK